MTTADLSPELLAELRRPRPYPAVSMTLPTHRTRPENAQDLIRLRNVLADAEKRLAADEEVGRADRIATAEHLKAAADELDPEHFLDGLVLYASPEEHYAFTVEAPVSERVVFSSTFLTRNLVSAAERATPYWVVVLGDDETHLWHGSGEELHEVRDGSFPITSSGPERDGPPSREGGGMAVAEDFRRLLDETDEALTPILERRPDPVVPVGLRPQVKAYRERTRHSRHLAEAELEAGGLQNVTPAELSRALAPAREALAREAEAAALAELDDARSGKRYAGGVQEVWGPARAGRGALLVVEEHFRATGRPTNVEGASEISLKLLTGPQAEEAVAAGTAEDDIVDTIVEAVLEADGKVVFVPDDTLADAGGIALALRY